MDKFNEDVESISETLEGWVMDKVESWRDHYETNYSDKHEEFYRLWRGIWAPEDRTRDSERSRIIAPALQQAVESSVAEIEEATFGRGRFFDIEDDVADQETQDVALLRETLNQEFDKTKVRKAVAECLINSAVFGTGIGEIVITVEKEARPATENMDNGLQAVGVTVQDKIRVRLRPVMPQNFLIDPVATCVEEALGCAIDEFVSRHTVEMLQEDGVYHDCLIPDAPDDFDIEPDQDLTAYRNDKIRLTKYYGFVPTDLLRDSEIFDGELEDKYYTEAVIVIANEGILLKAEPSPYMMQDRPVIAFPWDVVPGRFWGRGVCEKGYNSQKALDAELRARIDALALTVHPMLAMDATRIPRGSRPEVRPGKVLLTNGNPREVLNPFNFGDVSQITFAQAQALQTMVQQATGAIDSAGIAGSINGEATAAGISMSLGAIIKRHKRTLINFQESFLLPFVTKAAHRYMQFDPENFPVKDFIFRASSSLGIIAREYEVTQLVQLLQTMSPDSPLYPALVESIIDNMSISNREQLIEMIRKASQPDPEAQKLQQEAAQSQIDFQKAQTQAWLQDANESRAKATKAMAEARAIPEELQIDLIEAITRNIMAGSNDDSEFERRLAVADRALKKRDLDIKAEGIRSKTNEESRRAPQQPQMGPEE